MFLAHRKPHKIALEAEVDEHVRRDHAGQVVAPLHLGFYVWPEPQPVFCDVCGDAYLEETGSR